MALNPQERATTANQMMQILNNSGGGEGLRVFETSTTLSMSFVNRTYSSVEITSTNVPELYSSLSEFFDNYYDVIILNFFGHKHYFYRNFSDSSNIQYNYTFLYNGGFRTAEISITKEDSITFSGVIGMVLK